MERRRADPLTPGRDFATTLGVKLHIAVVVVLGVILGACDKPNDIPRLQDEITVAAKNFRKRYDDLADRLTAIGRRGDALGKSAETGGEAYKQFHEAKATVDEERRKIDGIPQQVSAASKSGSIEDLQKILDQNNEELEKELTKATWEADAAEAWLAQAEQGANAPEPPPTAMPPNNDTPPTETPNTTGAGAQPGTTGADVPGGTANPPTTGAPTPTGSNARH